MKERVDVIVSSVLGKDTLRGSDYRKGAILMLNMLHELMPTSSLTAMLASAVEIAELLYSDPSKNNITISTSSAQQSLCASKIMLRSF